MKSALIERMKNANNAQYYFAPKWMQSLWLQFIYLCGFFFIQCYGIAKPPIKVGYCTYIHDRRCLYVYVTIVTIFWYTMKFYGNGKTIDSWILTFCKRSTNAILIPVVSKPRFSSSALKSQTRKSEIFLPTLSDDIFFSLLRSIGPDFNKIHLTLYNKAI